MFGEFPPFLPTTVHDVTALNRYNIGERDGKHIIYTNHIPTRGRPFVHPTMTMENVLSNERMRVCGLRHARHIRVATQYNNIFMVVANTLDRRLTDTHDVAHAIDVSQTLIMCMRTWIKMQHAESTQSIDVSQDTS